MTLTADCTSGSKSAKSDVTGRFLIYALPAGQCAIDINGATATGDGVTHGRFFAGVDIAAGQTNMLPYTIWLTAIDISQEIQIPSPTTGDTVIKTAKIPGLELHLPKYTVIRSYEGDVVKKISITQIPLGRPPFPLPAGAAVPLYFTIQPGGAYVEISGSRYTPGIGPTLIYPNLYRAPAGRKFSFWNYDPDGRGWCNCPSLQTGALFDRLWSYTYRSVLGDCVGAFKILEKLGEGGMGAVYKARDSRLNRIVALKVLPVGRRSDPERRQRLLQEARSASAINHPNIVVTYEVGTADGTDYIAMEYIEGQTLKAIGERTGLPLPMALRYAADIAGALATAHAAGFIHRDLKPANVMIGNNGVVKILDFGLAKRAAPDKAEETVTLAVETREGVIMGSPGYMSPEQINHKKLDARSDIFNFGVLLYEMVTGCRAFSGDSTVATLSAVLRDDPLPPIEVVAGLPPELDRLIRRCLLKDPERRVQCMADVRVTLIELVESGAAEEVQRARPANSKLPWVAIGLGAAGLAIGTWIGFHPAREPDSISLATPVTGNPGTELGATFSPDGHEVAYPWDGGDEHPGNPDIYVKLIGSGAPLRLTRDPAADFSPAWSPDGRWIAFLRALAPDTVSLMVIPRLGGAERKIAEFSFSTFWLRMQTLNWSTDGKYVIAPVRPTTGGPAALHAIPLEGGDMRRLTTPPASATRGDFQPALSPDGREMAFAPRTETVSEIHIVKLSPQLMPGDDRVQRTFENRDNGSPAWTADGRELLFTSLLVNGTGTLWRVRARSTDPPRLVAEGATSVAISRDGSRVAFTRHVFEESVWRIDHAARPKRFIQSTRRDWEPHYSPDGRKILFTSDRTGSMQVWIAEADGSNTGQLTSMPASVTGGARLSPDGQTIVFLSNAEGQLEIYSMNVTGGGVRRLTNHPAHDSAPSWSRDGKWIYFASDRKGRYEVWKMPAGGGDPVQVTQDGGFAALESPDGQTLYYSKWVSAEGIWKMPVGGGKEVRVVPDLWRWGSWEVVGNGVFFVPAHGDSIQFYSFAGGTTETVAHLNRPTSFGLTATADGATILYPQVDQDRSELLVSEIFR